MNGRVPDFAILTQKVTGQVPLFALRYFAQDRHFTVFDLMKREKLTKLPRVRINIDFAKAEKSYAAGDVGPKARGPGVLEFSKVRRPMIVGRDPDQENYGNIGFIVDISSPYPLPEKEEGIAPHILTCSAPNMRAAMDRAFRKYLEHKDYGNIPVFDFGPYWDRYSVPDVFLVGFVDRLEQPLKRVRLLR